MLKTELEQLAIETDAIISVHMRHESRNHLIRKLGKRLQSLTSCELPDYAYVTLSSYLIPGDVAITSIGDRYEHNDVKASLEVFANLCRYYARTLAYLDEPVSLRMDEPGDGSIFGDIRTEKVEEVPDIPEDGSHVFWVHEFPEGNKLGPYDSFDEAYDIEVAPYQENSTNNVVCWKEWRELETYCVRGFEGECDNSKIVKRFYIFWKKREKNTTEEQEVVYIVQHTDEVGAMPTESFTSFASAMEYARNIMVAQDSLTWEFDAIGSNDSVTCLFGYHAHAKPDDMPAQKILIRKAKKEVTQPHSDELVDDIPF